MADPLLAACLDPAHLLVVVILEGVQAAGANPKQPEGDSGARSLWLIDPMDDRIAP
ncbi:MAG: hypothetical protein IT429_03765 [Gemmataceae bacterium]|nr:hypothetical protein [Gemmataceae bacterium]